ncbi:MULTISPECIES: hypothetical protein [unclassified Pseudofrankia]|uniref:MinD/ParA family ATP-binding protein n=1 Tax=unclassified Pseudofrankia TaxID=2994372 RepID=UPI0008D99065|nr:MULTISPECIES: hypothetical protein [unclassified Pseudofrankia]MDT3446615.1 hypothetical protein [Pseudofrankia sp. BMG5.37]OHV44464.1 hypothetical protein BCD48_02810 [Pseudofrankia sp. BMG5.36]
MASGRPAAQPPTAKPRPTAPPQAGGTGEAAAVPSGAEARSARPGEPTGSPAGGRLPAVPDRSAAARRPSGGLPPAVPADDAWDRDEDYYGDDYGSAPWDEIPLRESLADRAAAELPGSWRIGVTSAFPYSGATTLVGILGLVLTGARGESVLAVDLRPRTWPDEDPDEPRGDPLCSRVGLPGDVTVADIARRRGGASGALRELIGDPARPGTPELEVVPLCRGEGATSGGPGVVVPADDTVTPGMLRTALSHLTRAYPLVLVDAPVEAPLSPTALRASDLIVVVSLAAPADLDRTAAALRDPAAPLLPVDAQGRRPPVIVAVVSPRRGRWSPRTRAAAGRLTRHVDTLVRIPYESRLDPSRRAPVRIPRLRASTRRSYLHLGAAVVERLVRLAAEESTKAGATTHDATRGSTPETLRTPVV